MLRTFKDTAGREWTIRINISAMRRCKAAGADLSQSVEQLRSYVMDELYMTDCLWALVEPDAATKGITRDQFEESINGRVIADGRKAMWESLIEFYDDPNDPKARMLRAAIETIDREIAAAIGSLTSGDTSSNSKES